MISNPFLYLLDFSSNMCYNIENKMKGDNYYDFI